MKSKVPIAAWCLSLLMSFPSLKAEPEPTRIQHLGSEFGNYNAQASDGVHIAKLGNTRNEQRLALDGEWSVTLDPEKTGMKQQWQGRKLEGRPIRLPGTLDEAGYGTPANGRWWRYLNRVVEYIGPAWYQKEIVIPESWSGKRVTLCMERVMWESRVWVDDTLVGSQDYLCTPHVYDLTARLTPGRHRMTLRIDNSARVGGTSHGYGTDTQIRWNGVVGAFALTATDLVYIKSVQAYPDVAGNRVKAVVTVGNDSGVSIDVGVNVQTYLKGEGTPIPPANGWLKMAGREGRCELWIPMGNGTKLWDEFSPNLYEMVARVQAQWEGGEASHAKTATFGMRQIGRNGALLTWNGRTMNLRGTHDGGAFPLTGYPSCDPASWKRIFQACKDHGLNHVRYHTFCPPEAAFDAADELGMILQPEMPLWAKVQWGSTAASFVSQESERILECYGNHPSFAMYTLGNEHAGEWDVLDEIVVRLKNKDARHLYAGAANEYIRPNDPGYPVSPNDDFATIMWGKVRDNQYDRPRARYMERFMSKDEPVAMDQDWREIMNGFPVPPIVHELGQWWVFPSMAEIGKYTGVLRASNFEIYRDNLKARGLLDQSAAFQQASGHLAVELYKEDIERCLRTPGLAGFQLLDLHDYPGQGTSLVGLLDVFWDSKGLIRPEAFQRFCSATVPLARMPKQQWSGGETLSVPVEVYHYGRADLKQVTPHWRLLSADNRVVAEGDLPVCDIPTGRNTPIGTVTCPLPNGPAAMLRLEVSLPPVSAVNDWKLWVYPQQPPAVARIDAVRTVQSLDASTLDFLEKGGRVLLLGDQSPAVLPASFPNPIWNPFAFGVETCGLLIDAKSPAFANFPTENHTDWQWWDLMHLGKAFVFNGAPLEMRPLAQVIDQPLRCYRLGAIFEAKVGRGTIVGTSLNLRDDLEKRPAARQLRYSLTNYLASSACKPGTQLTREQLLQIVNGSRLTVLDGEPVPKEVVLDIHPAAQWNPKDKSDEKSRAWDASADKVIRHSDGFAYAVRRVQKSEWPGGIPVCHQKDSESGWMAAQFAFDLDCPVDFSGTVYVQFRDFDRKGERYAVMCGLDEAVTVGRHDGPGKWVAVSLRPEDTHNGHVRLVFSKPRLGYDWQTSPCVTRVIVSSQKP